MCVQCVGGGAGGDREVGQPAGGQRWSHPSPAAGGGRHLRDLSAAP